VTVVLSPMPDLNAKFQALLELAVSTITSSLGDSRNYLLLLMGSGAHGETCGVTIEGRILPLSDLDLLLLLPDRYDPALHKLLNTTLETTLAGELSRLKLTHNPVEMGMGTVANLKSVALTLENFEAVRNPVVLAGDPELLSPLFSAATGGPAPFEAFRLLINRVAEILVPRGVTDPVLAGMSATSAIEDLLLDPGPVATPSASDWHNAYRRGKLLLDMGKALVAATGVLEPFLAKRSALLEAYIAEQRPGQTYVTEVIKAWTDWRLAPKWPPPPMPMSTIAEMTELLLSALSENLLIPPVDVSDRTAIAGWRKVLAAERGPFKERLRRWVYMMRTRPGEVSSPQVTVLTLRWLGDSWPGSMASLLLLLFWLSRIGTGAYCESLGRRGGCLSTAVREIPVRHYGGAPMEEVLTGYLLWARRAGAC
jgi:hypothetical protein